MKIMIIFLSLVLTSIGFAGPRDSDYGGGRTDTLPGLAERVESLLKVAEKDLTYQEKIQVQSKLNVVAGYLKSLNISTLENMPINSPCSFNFQCRLSENFDHLGRQNKICFDNRICGNHLGPGSTCYQNIECSSNRCSDNQCL